MGECYLTKRSIVAAASKVYLYNEGDECLGLSGGWSSLGVYGYATGFVYTKEAAYLQVKGQSSSSGFNHVLKTLNKISFAGKSTLNMILSSTNEASNNNGMGANVTAFATSQAYYTGEGSNLVNVLKAGFADAYLLSVSIAGKADAYVYLKEQVTAAYKPLQTFKIHKVWLE